ncbi:hypothetical protein BsWGS_06990 [Bradybaena similaris]
MTLVFGRSILQNVCRGYLRYPSQSRTGQAQRIPAQLHNIPRRRQSVLVLNDQIERSFIIKAHFGDRCLVSGPCSHRTALGTRHFCDFTSRSHMNVSGVCVSRLNSSTRGGKTATTVPQRSQSSSATGSHDNDRRNGHGDDSRNTEEDDETEYGEYLREICTIPGMGHRVLVIQPDIKSGSRRYVLTTRELKLEETCALVRTLPNWKVVEQKIVRTDFERTKNVFGSGNFDQLLREIRSKKTISAVVIGIDRLSGLQINTLQVAWGLPVYDRYMLVLQIFKDHAESPEAKLQVALAEIHYVRSRMQLILGGYDAEMVHLVGGGSQMHQDQRHLLLQRRESRLKRELEKLHSRRQTVRQTRVHNSVPTVAVVGYTNSGKTTLIKALTDDPNLIPQNHLFATLDVSAHEGRLASSMKVTYIDTVGFISDMPTTLLDAFRATLDDALMADVILHVRDGSHPDRRLQVLSVHKTLKSLLGEDKLHNMLEVYNKVDLITEE